MTSPRGQATVPLCAIFLLSIVGCGFFRPSVKDVQTELTSLIDPALEAGLGGAERPEGDVRGQSCYEPFVGPANGTRPRLSYTFSWSILKDGPEAFLGRVESFWRSEGLEVEVETTDNARILFSGRDGYTIGASIIYSSMEAKIGGSGPCVD